MDKKQKEALKKIFNNCQKSFSGQSSLLKQLIDLYVKSEFDSFFEEFAHLLKYSLIYGDKQATVERTLGFVVKFSTGIKTDKKETEVEENDKEVEEEDEEPDVDPFLVAIFQFLLKNHEANSRSVRYRVCQLINKLLNNMGEHATIDDDLYTTIYDTMLQRLMDKVPAIRVQAILALGRLQDPRSKSCPVIHAYLFHLSMDPNPEVRKAVLNNIAITFQTLPSILERIRDVKDTVRKQAFLTLAQKVHIRSFTIAQRVLLISDGLNDRSDMVKICVKKNVLQAWLRLMDGSVLELLKCLDVEASTQSAELALFSLFENVPYENLLENFSVLNDNRMINMLDLTPESALYWKCLVKHFRSECWEDALDKILPDLSVFCTYLRTFALREVLMEVDPQDTAVRVLEKDFICQQLIQISGMFDLSDEVGKKSLDVLIRDLFISSQLGDSCLKYLSAAFSSVHPPMSRIDRIAEIISDVREPENKPEETMRAKPVENIDGKAACTTLVQTPKAPPRGICTPLSAPLSEDEERKRKVQLAQLRVKINTVKDSLEDCVRTLDLERAQELKVELKSLEEEHQAIKDAGLTAPLGTPATLLDASIIDETTKEEDIDEKMETEEEEKHPAQLDDPDTLARCLLILSEVLSSSDITTLGSTLRSLHDNLVVPCLKVEDADVRNHAVRALILICLVSKELAQQHLVLFVQIAQMDLEPIQLTALKGVFDFLHYHGIDDFNTAAENIEEKSEDKDDVEELICSENPAVSNIIGILSQMLENESCEIRTVAAEGLCKLLLNGRISSAKLLSHLIVMWYNPMTQDDTLLRHLLGVFFPLYASEGGSNQLALCASFLPTLQVLFQAPIRSPLAKVDIEDVANFIVSITSPAIITDKDKQGVNVHDTLVFNLCSEVIAFPERDYVKTLVRCLNHLTLTPTNFSSLRQVETLVEKMLKKVRDRPIIAGIEKFQKAVKSYLQFAPEETEEVEIKKEESADDTMDLSQAEVSQSSASMIRKKRTLYNTQSDMDLFSDLASTDNDTTDDEATVKISLGSSRTLVENASLVTVVSSAEVEISMPPLANESVNASKGLSSSDLFSTNVSDVTTSTLTPKNDNEDVSSSSEYFTPKTKISVKRTKSSKEKISPGKKECSDDAHSDIFGDSTPLPLTSDSMQKSSVSSVSSVSTDRPSPNSTDSKRHSTRNSKTKKEQKKLTKNLKKSVKEYVSTESDNSDSSKTPRKKQRRSSRKSAVESEDSSPEPANKKVTVVVDNISGRRSKRLSVIAAASPFSSSSQSSIKTKKQSKTISTSKTPSKNEQVSVDSMETESSSVKSTRKSSRKKDSTTSSSHESNASLRRTKRNLNN